MMLAPGKSIHFPLNLSLRFDPGAMITITTLSYFLVSRPDPNGAKISAFGIALPLVFQVNPARI